MLLGDLRDIMGIVRPRVVGLLLVVSLSSSVVLWWVTPPIGHSVVTGDDNGKTEKTYLVGMAKKISKRV